VRDKALKTCSEVQRKELTDKARDAIIERVQEIQENVERLVMDVQVQRWTSNFRLDMIAEMLEVEEKILRYFIGIYLLTTGAG
jgi:hypothetical protein